MTYGIKDILRLEVAPALGCTEPVAVSLAAAAAASLLPNHPREGAFEAIRVRVDPNVFKNGLAVSIPGTEGLHGLDMAAALGALAGDPARRLEVLAELTPDMADQAARAVAQGLVQVDILEKKGLAVEVEIVQAGHTAFARIEGVHDNIVSLVLDGRPVAEHALLTEDQAAPPGGLPALEAWLVKRELGELVALTEHLDDQDLAFLKQGVEQNMALAEYGLARHCGMAVGRTLDELAQRGALAKDMVLQARILAAAAADARMAGVNLPAMSSGGSGNHGLTAILPLKAVADHISADQADLLRAVALSHVVTAFVKAHTGRLSAVCGCSVAAGAGAAAGATLLLGHGREDVEQAMAGAIVNLMEDLAGVVCDGAKAGCALKLATAAGSAVQAALLSLNGVRVGATDGIIGATAECTMRNVGELSTQGMVEADRTIIGIMLRKRFAPAKQDEAQE